VDDESLLCMYLGGKIGGVMKDFFEWGTVVSILFGAGYCAVHGNNGDLFEFVTLIALANILVRVL